MEEDKIKQVAERLNAVSDQLSVRIAQEENRFKAMNLGVQCWLTVGDKKEFKVGYTNKEGSWGLYIAHELGGKTFEWRLAKAPRGLRLYALRKLPLLESHMVATAESLVERIERYLQGGADEQGALDEATGERGEGGKVEASGVEVEQGGKEAPPTAEDPSEDCRLLEARYPRRKGGAAGTDPRRPR